MTDGRRSGARASLESSSGRRRPAAGSSSSLDIAVGVGLAAIALSSAASTMAPFTLGAEMVTALGIVVLWASALGGPWAGEGSTKPFLVGRPGSDRRDVRRPLALWALICVAVVAFELIEYFSAPRSVHPTLSSILAALTAGDVGRGLVYLCWFVLGMWLALRSSAVVGLRRRGRS